MRMGYLLPSIMRRIDEFLLVMQLNSKILGHCVRDDLLVIATASPLAGNEYNYERLELLGEQVCFSTWLSVLITLKGMPSSSISLVFMCMLWIPMIPKESCTPPDKDISAINSFATSPAWLGSQATSKWNHLTSSLGCLLECDWKILRGRRILLPSRQGLQTMSRPQKRIWHPENRRSPWLRI